MAYNPELYMHELDRKAFEALNRFPKLVKLQEAYLANYDEKRAKIELLSSAIRLSPRQMPEIYNLLPSISNKLGIDIPDLYMVQSRDKKDLNAFTSGVKEPFICVTSELIKQCTPDMVSSVIAHECGHIACCHVLYHAIASSFYQGFENSPLYAIPAIRRYISPALIRAICFWDRCSELSADRAAVLCDNGSEKTIDMLLKIHGFEDGINREEFIKQSLDLKDFVNSSEVNKAMDMMINQWNTHPLLATRAYECYEWANSDQYKGIVDGSYSLKNKKEEIAEETETEFISAEVSLENKKTGAFGKDTVPPEVEQALNQRLHQVNEELDRYTSRGDKFLYAYSIACGVLSGIMDSTFFADTSILENDIGFSHKQVNIFIQEYAKSRGIGDDRLNVAIKNLEEEFVVIQDNIWKGQIAKVSAKNHHLADLAHHPTPVGLMSALVVQFLRAGTFVNRDGEWHFKFIAPTKEELIKIVVPAVITGVLNWLVNIAEEKYEAENGKEVPEFIHKLSHTIASTPEIIEIVKCADNWFGHLVSDMGGSKNPAGGGMGIPGIFISLLYEIGSLPVFKGTGLLEVVNDLYTNQKIDLRHELAYSENLKKQAIPVIFNELVVRIGVMLMRFEAELIDHGIKGINWRTIVPFGNRTIDQCLAIAHMTFNVVDTGDSAMRAAIESGGNWVVFSGRFVARYNYVGAARAALSIVKEVSNENKEAQLIHERMLLMDAKAQIMYQQLQQFKAQLDEKLANYLAEDIEAFIEGFDYMKEGLASNDSDLVIKGNVIIQKVLGREPQFTTQKEFDDLMESDDAFQF